MKNIYQAICAAQEDITPIAKNQRNKQQGYSFRGIDPVYESIQPIFTKHRIFTVPEVLDERSEERRTTKGGVLIYRILRVKYTFYSEDGSSISAVGIGEGMDSGDKASNKAMAVAHKYALCQVFTIPTKEKKDPEEDDHKLAPSNVNEYILKLQQMTAAPHYHNFVNKYRYAIKNLPREDYDKIKEELLKTRGRLGIQ